MEKRQYFMPLFSSMVRADAFSTQKKAKYNIRTRAYFEFSLVLDFYLKSVLAKKSEVTYKTNSRALHIHIKGKNLGNTVLYLEFFKNSTKN